MSFRIAIAPNRKAATRFVGKVRRRLVEMLADNPQITRTQIADALDVHRSVITKQLNGKADISLARVAEIAWAAGYRPTFDLEKLEVPDGSNRSADIIPAVEAKFVTTQSSTNAVVDLNLNADRLLVEVQ